jgi:biopolymer transport protein ExbD
MNVGGGDEENLGVMATINTTPLVDVMMVLLIIFLITIPVITKQIKVNLPKAVNIPTQTKPENITISVDTEGQAYWNGRFVPTRQTLLDYVKNEAVKKPQPEIHIRADKNTRFEAIGRVLYSIQRGGVIKVGFIIEPDRGVQVAR